MTLEPGEGLQLEFNSCKLKKDETCTLKARETYDNETDVYTSAYKVTDDGETLEDTHTGDGVSETIIYRIAELDEKSLKLEGQGEYLEFNYNFEKE